MNPILLQVLNRPWYIDYNSAVDYGWAIKALLDGKLVFETDQKVFEPKMVLVNADAGSGSNLKGRQVAVIPLQGPLMQKDQYCGPRGMETIGRYIKEADKNPDVAAIILDGNTPGGTVAGTANLGKIVAETTKPIIGFVNELVASAGYWIFANCDYIIASDAKAQVGSIGVMTSFADLKPAYELMGIKFHDVVSDLSTEKNKDYKLLQAGQYDEYKKNVLNPLAERFIANVKEGRKGKITDESIFKGRIDFADKAIEVGLVDKIASFDETVSIALEMATKNEKEISANQIITNPISSMKKRPLLLAALKVESLEASDGGSFLNEAQLDAVEAGLAANQAALDAVTAERDQANASVKTAQDKAVQDVTAKDSEITALKSAVEVLKGTVDALKKNPAEAGASLIAKNEVVDKTTGEDTMLKELEACENAKERMAVMQKYRKV